MSSSTSSSTATAAAIPREVAFLICVAGIYASYISFGVYQEEINTTKFGPEKKKFDDTTFLLLCQCIVNALSSVLVMLVLPTQARDKTPTLEYVGVSLTYIGAMFCSNAAIQYVNYPTMVLAKSCKPIPVLLMGLLVLRKQQSWSKYICVVFVTAGISIFMLNEKKSSKDTTETSTYGIVLLLASLAMDGVTGPFQERLIKNYSPSSNSMMLYTNLWASAILLIMLVATNTVFNGIQFCIEFPQMIYLIGMFSLTSAIGQQFIYYTIFAFGSLVCSLTTTTRKFFNIFVSVLRFGHSLSDLQWFGVFIVFAGLGIDIFHSYTSSNKGKKKPE